MDAETRQLVLLCFAWAGLRHWCMGRDAGDAARDVVDVRLNQLPCRAALTGQLFDLESVVLERLSHPLLPPL